MPWHLPVNDPEIWRLQTLNDPHLNPRQSSALFQIHPERPFCPHEWRSRMLPKRQARHVSRPTPRCKLLTDFPLITVNQQYRMEKKTFPAVSLLKKVEEVQLHWDVSFGFRGVERSSANGIEGIIRHPGSVETKSSICTSESASLKSASLVCIFSFRLTYFAWGIQQMEAMLQWNQMHIISSTSLKEASL